FATHSVNRARPGRVWRRGLLLRADDVLLRVLQPAVSEFVAGALGDGRRRVRNCDRRTFFDRIHQCEPSSASVFGSDDVYRGDGDDAWRDDARWQADCVTLSA